MRKWAVIALASIALAGVFAWLANRDPLEDLKRKYISAIRGDVWTERVRHRSVILIGGWDAAKQRKRKRLNAYERELIKAGRFKERTFVVSNREPSGVMRNAQLEWALEFRDSSFYPMETYVLGGEHRDEVVGRFRIVGTNLLILVAPKEYMPTWERIVSGVETGRRLSER